MAQNAVIRLDTSIYRTPTQKELNDGKAYVRRRNDTALALTAVIGSLLEALAEDIIRLCYNDNTSGADFKITDDESRFAEICDMMDEAMDEVMGYIQEYSLKCTDSDMRSNMLLLYLLSLGRGNKNLANTLGTYMKRFLYDIEALIAAYKNAGYNMTTALTKAKTSLRNVYQQPEVKAAYKVPNMRATYIASKGIHYDFETGKGTVGLSANGATNVIYLAETTLNMVWMRSEALDYKQEGAAGYYQFRGSNYPCQLCDSEVGFHVGIDNIVSDPYPHPHCMCYRIPIFKLNGN